VGTVRTICVLVFHRCAAAGSAASPLCLLLQFVISHNPLTTAD
jgi:hypothetical protein